MSLEVKAKTISPKQVLSITQHVKVGGLSQTIEDGPIEICLPVRGNVKGRENVVFKQLFGGNAACVTMIGEQCEFPAILKGYDAAAAWIKENGHHTSGSPREIWHSVPGPDAKMEIVQFYR